MVTEAGSYLRLIDFCITKLKAQGPSRTCNESKEDEKKHLRGEQGGERSEGAEESNVGVGGPPARTIHYVI